LERNYGAGVLDNYLNRGLLPPANDNWSPAAPASFAAPATAAALPIRELQQLIGEMRNNAEVSAAGSNAMIRQMKALQQALEKALEEHGDKTARSVERKPRTAVRA
jgi:hypothetical protein